MRIAQIIKGFLDSADHILLIDRAESKELMEVYTFYCENNKRKIKAKRTLKQLEEELQIY